MTKATLMQTAPGHEVLAAAGKKYLRPGGRIATEQLLEWANFQPGETVLELAASFGYSAISLAQRYGVKVVGVEKKPESVRQARDNIRAANLENQIEIIEGDIFHLDAIPGQFDYVLAEAILTMQSPPGKAKILQGIRDCLKPGGKFLSHELLARDNEEQIRALLKTPLNAGNPRTGVFAELAQVIRVNATPLSEANWINIYEAAGLHIEKVQTGAMSLLNFRQMFQDEGIVNTLRILGNILTREPIRKRVLEMRRVFNKYHEELGYILICATTQ
ncbi:SAM-dependent methyltransferase [Chroogloeocystis siderophila]|jgi:cyclopropane fatty-acyl-phospholipid synthase-like methyltransferase|uniref:SAM-dependent methyltransferase n=1 Tax=Chroogloeocystis siderophila 5.2 s.c.1 TaxID=247279 RepID=A0A1U7HV91_9CHRO|nr:class I SAM-dependent methyltransferase [Chroogloeocystis siderophila]OKH27444.1 SAM-dependent methyltransferase [Chroogloeocystis siderophila 5.2 s.c.1]